jgi:DNA-binding protein H-NS
MNAIVFQVNLVFIEKLLLFNPLGVVMDISSFSLAELKTLQEQIKQEMKKREHDEMSKARDQIFAIARNIGVPLKDIIGNPVQFKAAVPVRYRHPDNASLQWTGRGRQPGWIKDWMASGKSLDLIDLLRVS